MKLTKQNNILALFKRGENYNNKFSCVTIKYKLLERSNKKKRS